jgi:hypothetical protein
MHLNDEQISEVLLESLSRYDFSPIDEVSRKSKRRAQKRARARTRQAAGAQALRPALQALNYIAIRVMEGYPTMTKIKHAARIFRKYFISPRNIEEGYYNRLHRDPSETADLMKEIETEGEESDLSRFLNPNDIKVSLEEVMRNLESIKSSVSGLMGKHNSNMSNELYSARFRGVKTLILRHATSGQEIKEKIINLEEVKLRRLDENFLHMFGSWVKFLLRGLFGDFDIPVSVIGKKKDVEHFAKVIGSEKKYIETAKQHGLNHAATYKDKAKLDNAVKKFEKATGISWPFK